jgi:hypothetical protein
MRRNINRQQPATRVMRRGKTRRDRESGAWHNHRLNKEWRRLEGAQPPAGR